MPYRIVDDDKPVTYTVIDDEPPKKELPFGMQTMANIGGGMLRGAGSIGATILSPVDWAARKLNDGKPVSIGGYDIVGQDRRARMDSALSDMGVDTNSLAFGAGKIGTEIAGTLGVGGGLASGAAKIPGIAPTIVKAIETAGMTTGKSLPLVRDLMTRGLGGAITGGASAFAIDPADTWKGAAIGAAAPPVFMGLGAVGRAVGNAVVSGDTAAARQLVRALEVADPEQAKAITERLRNAESLVPGSAPTVAQALGTPQAGILERVVGDSAGGSGLKTRYAAQSQARTGALESVAPTIPTGKADARQNLGQAVADYAKGARGAARAATTAKYAEVPQDEAMLYLPDLGAIRDQFYKAGSFVDRSAVDDAVNAAQKIGTLELPAVSQSGKASSLSLAQAVRKAGGINANMSGDVAGEARAMRGDLKNLLRVNGGRSVDDMAQAMHEAGYIGDESADTLIQALKSEAMGAKQYAGSADDVYRAAADSAYGDMPQAGAVPKKVTLSEFESLRRDIGSEARKAAIAGNDRSAKALNAMKQSLDDRLNEVVRGDGAIDEVLPIDWADKLTAARKSKADEVARFGTGPQARIFKQGSDGSPLLQGGEVATAFWGQRPGLADDVKAFRRLIDDKPELLGGFRSMVTTEGAATASAQGNLGNKFAQWVDQSLPGLKEAFRPKQVETLRNIAKDIRRAEVAAGAGMSRGSNTYQNASNALRLGLLDNPLLNGLANRIPVVNRVSGPSLKWMQDTARESMARRLGGLLMDPEQAAAAIDASFRGSSSLIPEGVGLLGYRALPALVADR